MPRVFDNLDQSLLEGLQNSFFSAYKSDFCIGYFNLRGWRLIADQIEQFSGEENNQCRVLIGMQKLPSNRLYQELQIITRSKDKFSQGRSEDFKTLIAGEFRQQLMAGIPTNADYQGLQQLKKQLINQKVVVKLHLRYPLHAKLYLIHQRDPNLPIIGYLGSSNLTFSGLKSQGELNIDVLDHDATQKLQDWFEGRWEDNFCMDISAELAQIIDESWATEKLIPPYYIYLKMAYHLSQEARDGLSQYQIPSGFQLFKFQEEAVKIAARHVNRRGGVIIGDVVGLGKTMIATAVARLLEEDLGVSTLIICPKNLVSMWQSYQDNYGLRAKILPISMVEKQLNKIPGIFRLLIIDESHNLRNRDGKRYAVIKDYIQQSGSRCILLTATPYNKSYLDISAQLRLFIEDHQDLGIQPNKLISNVNFIIKYPNISPRTLSAFEKSEFPEDWQELMSRYMIRRTRSFIRDNYAKSDISEDISSSTNQNPVSRKYLELGNGSRSYFPARLPKTVKFKVDKNDPYTQLYSTEIVDLIGNLNLPRYALGSYQLTTIKEKLLTDTEKKLLGGLKSAGRNLIGFCRTNLFKRLESSGYAFIQSIERHILRNYIYLYAIESGQDIPIGAQNNDLFSTVVNDQDTDSILSNDLDIETISDDDEDIELFEYLENRESIYQEKAQKVYDLYQTKYQKRFKWIRPNLFNDDLAQELQEDAYNLIKILSKCPTWNTENDQKLLALWELLTKKHPDEKVLIFSQFADTVTYLTEKLTDLGMAKGAGVTGKSANPTTLAQNFSPKSNNKPISAEEELRILIATDVLSEGQNLQDCRIIVNYDLPWAIIRLIQRAGRVDRIGQKAEEILCYSFLPADGVEDLINLRGRLVNRLRENAEVVGTDEVFFEDSDSHIILNLYNEKSGIYDEVEDNEVDLVSSALSIWETAKQLCPEITTKIEQLPNVVYSTRHHEGDSINPQGVLVYMRTGDGVDALAYVDKNGNSVTQSQSRILRLAQCELATPAIERHQDHFQLVAGGAKIIIEQQKTMMAQGALGSRHSARHRSYTRLDAYTKYIKESSPILAQGMEWDKLIRALEDIYKYPLQEKAVLKINRQLKSSIRDEQLADMVVSLWDDSALTISHEDNEVKDSQIICSLGLF
ncbi:MAG: NgoFVII family restriction endonuclease [Cyanobacterium sp. T60_A2020_053]|nr:NgoFVII family restriction endonuclease [Cyanobacterium sp. T60_A2020_053]